MVELVQLGHSLFFVSGSKQPFPPALDGRGPILHLVEARIFGDAVQVSVSCEASAKRTPDCCAKLLFVKKSGVLNFKFLSVEDILLRLFSDWADQIMLSADQKGLHDK